MGGGFSILLYIFHSISILIGCYWMNSMPIFFLFAGWNHPACVEHGTIIEHGTEPEIAVRHLPISNQIKGCVHVR